MDGGGSGTNSKSSYSTPNNQTSQNMNPKTTFEETDNNSGSGNSNLSNSGSSINNTNNTNQPQQDFNLDDLNFDPAALIGGNGENTDLNVSIGPHILVQV